MYRSPAERHRANVERKANQRARKRAQVARELAREQRERERRLERRREFDQLDPEAEPGMFGELA